MKRSLGIFVALALLALPLAVRAEDSTIPPEMRWTPYPPAHASVDEQFIQLVEVLVKRGVITMQDLPSLAQPHLATPVADSRETAREPDASSRSSR